jgi:hypothetical protein
MKVLRVLAVVPIWFLLIADASPSPIPQGANLVLDTAAGQAGTRITVTGSGWFGHQKMDLYWDSPNKVAASVETDRNGNFTQVVTPYPGDRIELHDLCASIPPKPCATFNLQGPPSPAPAESPSPATSSAPSPSPTPSTSFASSALQRDRSVSGLDVITKPPFVFLPIIGLLGLLAALAYWVLIRGLDRSERLPALPSATVVHRSARPDIERPATPSSRSAPTREMEPPPSNVPPPGPSETPKPPAY